MLKAEAINQAYAEIRISGLTVDPSPEDNELALRELDQLMTLWRGKRRDVGYNFPEPTADQALVVSDPSDVLGVVDWALQGVICSLALRLLPYFGKEAPPVLAAKSRGAVNVIKQNTVKVPDVPYPNRMPRGSGNTVTQPGYVWRYYYPAYDGRPIRKPIVYTQVLDCFQDFSNFLADGDTIESYVISAEDIKLISHAQDGNVINFRVEADKQRDGWVEITITTTGGQVLPQRTLFNTQALPG